MSNELNFYPGLLPSPLDVRPPSNTSRPVMDPNSPLNFEQRILRPSQYPALPLSKRDVATHLMGWGEANGKNVVFPTVVQTPRGNLVNLGDDAFRYALQTGEFRSFDTPKDAANYAEGGYKHWWGFGDTMDIERLGKKK